jgi:hypothetical protein
MCEKKYAFLRRSTIPWHILFKYAMLVDSTRLQLRMRKVSINDTAAAPAAAAARTSTSSSDSLESETNLVVRDRSESLPIMLAPAFNSLLRLRLDLFGLESWRR